MARSEIHAKIFRTDIAVSLKDSKNITRATLEFHGINHAGPSYEARVFLNNKNANEKTKKSESTGYVGSFYIFGHGGRCYGGPGHCKIPQKDSDDPYDIRRSNPLTPTFRYITITRQLQKLVKKTNKIALTVVPIPKSYNEMADFENLLQFEKLSLITYDK
ncbi:hypothetical protein [Nitrosarchaeum sp. AC2]|uniref:hypothetical protein n=1 Tax=Nitrosarchaeum sp. AC2 TaxID=2259673 RepID=UPI0015C74D2C|nr:hypothetical protein [Nitrosarchaeum sp. AC2]